MIQSPQLLAIAAVVLVGTAVMWANPRRPVNVLFFTVALHISLWLLFVHLAVAGGEEVIFVRWASAIGAFIPVHTWFLKEASIAQGAWPRVSRRILPWFLVAAGLTLLTLSEKFAQAGAVPGTPPRFGLHYHIYMLGFLGMYVMLARETIRQIRAQHGLVRLELQILLLGGAALAFTIMVLMALRSIVGAIWPIHLQPVAVLIFYAGTMVAITTHRVFDARQLVLVAVQKMILVLTASGAGFAVDRALSALGVPEILSFLITVSAALWFVSAFNNWLHRIFQFYPEATVARQAAFAAAQRETRLENLMGAFKSVLVGWGQSERAMILAGTRELISGEGVQLAGDCALVTTMRELRWVTPERLARERITTEREEVAAFLRQHELGVLTISEGTALSVLIGVGRGASRLPFTYPQVMQLIELASIVENALERAHFSQKVQHAEQLATVGLLGASLAHEIRNPLVSIKTFVQLLPHHHHDPAFRNKFFRLISDEVGRIDLLTEQLLDLASPRVYSAQLVELHPLLRASIDLVAAKAADRNISVLTEFEAAPDHAFTDAAAAKQVMLNLCFNAIQAVESKGQDAAERWVRIATRNIPAGVEMAVEDSGPGIAPEIRPKLFQPFQTTKSTGFGLGLAICKDILTNLHANITVDPPAPGCGATFRVTFPCRP